ncbi:hypothetical protein ACIHFC_30360 [Streptomyces sp. NPDC052013]|uniref:hypothetical protein n=1 Tax=Streptomyces sp. NPDC052013 TaxID=3365679 RepID=UPI0037D508CA
MRRMRIEKPRQSARTRRYQDETPARGSAQGPSGLRASLDPRDPDIVRAKRLTARGGDGSGRA